MHAYIHICVQTHTHTCTLDAYIEIFRPAACMVTQSVTYVYACTHAHTYLQGKTIKLGALADAALTIFISRLQQGRNARNASHIATYQISCFILSNDACGVCL